MTDKSRVWADDDPRRRVDEAADQDVAAAEQVSAADDQHGAREQPHPATTPPGVLNDDSAADAEAADKTSPDVDPLSERIHAVDPDFDAGSLGPTSDMLAEDEPDLGEKAGAAAPVGAYVGTRRAPGRGLGHVAEHDTDDWWRTWLGRTVAVLGAVLVLATGMIWAWIGGLHSPQAKNIPVAVVASDPVARAALVAVRQNTDVLEAKVYSSAADASNALNKHQVDAILASDATLLGGLNLTVASGSGPGVADTVATTIGSAAQNVNVPLAIEDVYPLSAGDSRGLTPFWLTLAWILGGLLAAVALGIAIGTVPRDLDRLGMRLGALAVFSLLLGLLGAVFAGPFLGVWHKHTVGLWLAGSLITFTAALIASALQSWLGLWGVGLAAVLMLVLGVPGSGGPVAAPFLPGFFRGMPRWLPNGLGTDLVRGVEYFGRNANTWSITGLTLWSLASILALVGATAVLGRRARTEAHQRAARAAPAEAAAG